MGGGSSALKTELEAIKEHSETLKKQSEKILKAQEDELSSKDKVKELEDAKSKLEQAKSELENTKSDIEKAKAVLDEKLEATSGKLDVARKAEKTARKAEETANTKHSLEETKHGETRTELDGLRKSYTADLKSHKTELKELQDSQAKLLLEIQHLKSKAKQRRLLKNFTYTAFISHSKRRKHTHPSLTRHLKSYLDNKWEKEAFLDVDNIVGSKKITKKTLKEAIDVSAIFLLVLDDCTLLSPWCRSELEYAARTGVPIHVMIDVEKYNLNVWTSSFDQHGIAGKNILDVWKWNDKTRGAASYISGNNSYQVIDFTFGRKLTHKWALDDLMDRIVDSDNSGKRTVGKRGPAEASSDVEESEDGADAATRSSDQTEETSRMSTKPSRRLPIKEAFKELKQIIHDELGDNDVSILHNLAVLDLLTKEDLLMALREETGVIRDEIGFRDVPSPESLKKVLEEKCKYELTDDDDPNSMFIMPQENDPNYVAEFEARMSSWLTTKSSIRHWSSNTCISKITYMYNSLAVGVLPGADIDTIRKHLGITDDEDGEVDEAKKLALGVLSHAEFYGYSNVRKTVGLQLILKFCWHCQYCDAKEYSAGEIAIDKDKLTHAIQGTVHDLLKSPPETVKIDDIEDEKNIETDVKTGDDVVLNEFIVRFKIPGVTELSPTFCSLLQEHLRSNITENFRAESLPWRTDAVVLRLVRAKMGNYIENTEKLDLSTPLEIDLGDGRTKRVEILSEVQKQLCVEVADVDAFRRLETVKDVISFLDELRDGIDQSRLTHNFRLSPDHLDSTEEDGIDIVMKKPDPERAEKLAKLAVLNHDDEITPSGSGTMAQVIYAKCHLDDPDKYQEAVALLEQAAEAGHAESMYTLFEERAKKAKSGTGLELKEVYAIDGYLERAIDHGFDRKLIEDRNVKPEHWNKLKEEKATMNFIEWKQHRLVGGHVEECALKNFLNKPEDNEAYIKGKTLFPTKCWEELVRTDQHIERNHPPPTNPKHFELLAEYLDKYNPGLLSLNLKGNKISPRSVELLCKTLRERSQWARGLKRSALRRDEGSVVYRTPKSLGDPQGIRLQKLRPERPSYMTFDIGNNDRLRGWADFAMALRRNTSIAGPTKSDDRGKKLTSKSVTREDAEHFAEAVYVKNAFAKAYKNMLEQHKKGLSIKTGTSANKTVLQNEVAELAAEINVNLTLRKIDLSNNELFTLPIGKFGPNAEAYRRFGITIDNRLSNRKAGLLVVEIYNRPCDASADAISSSPADIPPSSPRSPKKKKGSPRGSKRGSFADHVRAAAAMKKIDFEKEASSSPGKK